MPTRSSSGAFSLHTLFAAFGWLRHFPVIAREVYGALSASRSSTKTRTWMNWPLPIQAIPFHDVQFLGVHPAIGAEPRLRS